MVFSLLSALPRAGGSWAAPALGAAIRRMSTATGDLDLRAVLAGTIPKEQVRSGRVTTTLGLFRNPVAPQACLTTWDDSMYRVLPRLSPVERGGSRSVARYRLRQTRLPAPVPPAAAPRPSRAFKPPTHAPKPRSRAPQARLKKIKTSFGSQTLGEVTVDQAIGGMRGIPVGNRRARPAGRSPLLPAPEGRGRPGAGPSGCWGRSGPRKRGVVWPKERRLGLRPGRAKHGRGQLAPRKPCARACSGCIWAAAAPAPRVRGGPLHLKRGARLRARRACCGRRPCWMLRRASGSAATASPSCR